MKRPLLLIIAAGIVFITLPLFFERLHSDEVIYWEVAKNISIGLGAVSETSGNSVFSWHMPLAFYIVAPFLKLSAHIFTARIVSSFFTIASAVLIFLICRKSATADEALVSALLFIFSFQVLRFGGRYYLDQYGLFFFLLSLYLLHEERFFISGAVAVMAVGAREYWAGVYPFLLLYLGLRDRRALPWFIVPAAAVTLFLTLYTVYSKDSYGLWRYLAGGAALDNIKASVSGVVAYPLARGWVEFSVLNILTLAGFLAAFRMNKSHIVIVIPQVIVISLIHGFVLEGGVTQYPLALIGTLAVYSGPGLKDLYDRLIGPINGRQRFKAVILVAVTAQFIFFNAFSTAVSLHKNLGVYGFGYGDDREVISILNREAKGEFIHGIWGAFVEKRGRWDWTDYLVREAIEKDPDWLVTYDNYVEVIGGQNGPAGVAVYRVGPYVMVHSLHRGPLKEFVRSKVFPKWKFREGGKVKD